MEVVGRCGAFAPSLCSQHTKLWARCWCCWLMMGLCRPGWSLVERQKNKDWPLCRVSTQRKHKKFLKHWALSFLKSFSQCLQLLYIIKFSSVQRFFGKYWRVVACLSSLCSFQFYFKHLHERLSFRRTLDEAQDFRGPKCTASARAILRSSPLPAQRPEARLMASTCHEQVTKRNRSETKEEQTTS